MNQPSFEDLLRLSSSGFIGVVSHDAGAAEVISSFIKRNNLSCIYCLEGPAKSIFEKKIQNIKSTPRMASLSFEFMILSSLS